MITTYPCDQGNHADCPGEGVTQGLAHHPHDLDRANWWKQWVTVECECPCHRSGGDAPLREATPERLWPWLWWRLGRGWRRNATFGT